MSLEPTKHTKDTKGVKRSKLIYPEESYAIIGACFNVYKLMGCGFLEAVYQECLEIEFSTQNIPFHSQFELTLKYRDHPLKQHFKPDFVCYEKIVIELKAVSTLVDEHRAQVLNYLNATKMQLGLLVNFGHYPKLEYERFILTTDGAKNQPINLQMECDIH
ncbi:MAG: GxxExxY protein [bacterium]